MQNYPTLTSYTEVMREDEFAVVCNPHIALLEKPPDKVFYKYLNSEKVECLTQHNGRYFKTIMTSASFEVLSRAIVKGATIEEVCALIIN